MKRLVFPLAVAGLLISVLGRSAAAPAENGTNDRILQQELKQQQIKTTTQRVADQLASIIAEFDRNQIAGEDVKVLKAVRNVLGALTEKDMQVVIAYLQEAREAVDPAAGQRRVTEAFSRQKGIILQLKQLLAEYQREHRLYLLSLRFKELARKESEIMRLGVRLAKTTEGKAVSSFGELEQNSLKLQQIEQDALKAEIGLAVGELEKLSKEITDGPTAGRPKAAVEQIKEGGLIAAIDTALTELSKGLILSATGNEKKARDQLREVARLLILSEDKIEALRQALHELEQTIDQQHSVVNDTRKIDTRDSANEVENKQAEVVDNTDLIRRDVDSLAPIAAEHLSNATDKMQEARGSLTASEDPRKRREKALPKQDDALTSMEQARRALQEQLAKAEESSNQPQNTLASLKELQQQVQELMERERAHKDDTAAAKATDLAAKAPQQGELKDTAQDLQQKASSPAPAAAQSIGEAANQMQKAQNSLAAARNNPAAQQAAIDALEKAEQQLGQQIAKLEQAEKDLAQLDELLKRLEGIIDDQQKLQFGTAKETAAPETKPLTDLAGQQEKLGKDTGQLQQETTTPAPAAAPHLGKAKDHMDQAKQALDKPAAQAAQPRQTEALSDLYAAKKEMEKQRDALRDMLGMPSDDNGNLADAQSLIEQAQEDVNQAMQQMQQGQENLSESLRQQQQKIADALSAASQNAPAQSPANKAQQAAQQAAQQLAQSDLPNAVKSMQSAQSAMQQAMQGKPGQQGKAEQDDASSALPQLSQQQAEVQKAAESLMTALQAAPAAALQKAAQSLEHAGHTIGPLTSGQMGAMPAGAQSALESAEQALASGAAQASSGQGPPAQASAAAAAQALAQAQAALSLAQAGLGSQPGNQPGNQPGQGQGQGQGQGRNPGRTPGTPGPQGDGQGNWAGAGGTQGARRGTAGSSTFVGLPKRDRAALQQSQSEKYPQEYGPLVEQYLKNLSDQAAEK